MCNGGIFTIQENFKNKKFTLVVVSCLSIIVACLAVLRKVMSNLDVLGAALEQWPLTNTVKFILVLVKVSDWVHASVNRSIHVLISKLVSIISKVSNHVFYIQFCISILSL